jgi:hypothetical protein
MGVVRKVRDTKMSASRHASVAAVVQDAPVIAVAARAVPADVRDLSAPEMFEPALFGPEPMAFEACALEPEPVPLLETGVNRIASVAGRSEHDDPDASEVFVKRTARRGRDANDANATNATEKRAAEAATAAVTLFVYGWHQVEPGALSWVFPSLRAALDAVRTMRNAAEWSICSGASWNDIESARAKGAVLIEQLG